MILRITFNDNDFTQIIEKFLETHICFGIRYILEKYIPDNSKEAVAKFCEISKKIDKYVSKLASYEKFNPTEEEDFINILKESLLDYIKDHYPDDYEYLCKELKIKLLNSMTDKWENGEAVYYFTQCDTKVIL